MWTSERRRGHEMSIKNGKEHDSDGDEVQEGEPKLHEIEGIQLPRGNE